MSSSQTLAYAVYLLIAGVAILLTIPPFLGGYIVGHDLLYHLNWAELFHKQLFEGDLYPRWLFDMKGGRGSPVFYFYSPLPYYISAFFALILPTANNTWHALGATYCFALLVSSVGMFKFLCMSSSRGNALLFTIFYMLFPYHIVVDLNIRFAYAEFFAIAWVPYLFIFTRRLAEDQAYAFCGLAIFYALLILSHIPSTLLITPFILVYYFVCHGKPKKQGSVITSLTMGMSLAAFYLLPVFALRNEVSIDRMMFGHVYYENAFLLANNGLFIKNVKFWAFLNNLSIVTLILTFLALLSQQKIDRLLLFFSLSSFFCIFMMYPVSNLVWNILPILMIVQFPWRFFIVISFTLFFLATPCLNTSRTTLAKYSFFLTIIIMTSLSVLTGYVIFLQSSRDISEANRATIEKSRRTREGVVEYLPVRSSEIYFQKINSLTLDRIDQLLFSKGLPIEYVYRITGGEIHAAIETKQNQTITMNQFYFPTWQGIYANGTALQIHNSPEGFLEFTLDKGVHNLVFSHLPTQAEKIGSVMSLFSMCYIFLRLSGGFLANKKIKSPENKG